MAAVHQGRALAESARRHPSTVWRRPRWWRRSTPTPSTAILVALLVVLNNIVLGTRRRMNRSWLGEFCGRGRLSWLTRPSHNPRQRRPEFTDVLAEVIVGEKQQRPARVRRGSRCSDPLADNREFGVDLGDAVAP